MAIPGTTATMVWIGIQVVWLNCGEAVNICDTGPNQNIIAVRNGVTVNITTPGYPNTTKNEDQSCSCQFKASDDQGMFVTIDPTINDFEKCTWCKPWCYAKLVVNANISRDKISHVSSSDSKTYCLPSNTSTYNRQHVTSLTISYTRGSNTLVTNKGKFLLTVKFNSPSGGDVLFVCYKTSQSIIPNLEFSTTSTPSTSTTSMVTPSIFTPRNGLEIASSTSADNLKDVTSTVIVAYDGINSTASALVPGSGTSGVKRTGIVIAAIFGVLCAVAIISTIIICKRRSQKQAMESRGSGDGTAVHYSGSTVNITSPENEYELATDPACSSSMESPSTAIYSTVNDSDPICGKLKLKLNGEGLRIQTENPSYMDMNSPRPSIQSPSALYAVPYKHLKDDVMYSNTSSMGSPDVADDQNTGEYSTCNSPFFGKPVVSPLYEQTDVLPVLKNISSDGYVVSSAAEEPNDVTADTCDDIDKESEQYYNSRQFPPNLDRSVSAGETILVDNFMYETFTNEE